jgi:ethanolamine-phosphate cytidylyltransferase
VSDVIIGAPYTVTEFMLDSLKINFVVQGQTPVNPDEHGNDPYEVPQKRGIYRTVDSGNILTTDVIMRRIIQNRLEFARRNSVKEEKELNMVEAEKKRRVSTQDTTS